MTGATMGLGNRQAGFMLVTVLGVALVLSILAIGVTRTALVDRQTSASQRTATHAYYVAKSGIARLEAALINALNFQYFNEEEDVCGLEPGQELDLGDLFIRVGDDPVNVGFYGFENWLSYNIIDNLIYLRSTGVVGPATQTVQVVADIGPGPSSVYDNAIFTERVTPKSGSLAGTISVYGSIHVIRGDLEVDDSAINLTGAAGIYNNYMGSGLGNPNLNVSEEALNVFSAEGMRTQDLCTRVKIKSGSLEIGQPTGGDKTKIGAPDVAGGPPEAIKGMYFQNGTVTSKGEPVEPDQETAEALASDFDVFTRDDIGFYGAAYDISMPQIPDNYPPADAVLVDDPALCPLLGSYSEKGTTREAFRLMAGLGAQTCQAIDPVSGEIVTVFEWNGVDTLTVDPAFDGRAIAFPDHGFYVGTLTRYVGEANLLFGTKVAGTDVYEAHVQFSAPLVPKNLDYLTGSTLAITTNGTGTLSASSAAGLSGNDPTIAAIVFVEDLLDVQAQAVVFGSLIAGEVATKSVPSVAHNNLVADKAEELCLYGSTCAGGVSGENDGMLSKMTEENL